MGLPFFGYLLDLTWELNWWTVVWWGGTIVGILHLPSVLMRRETRPMAALAWILCLLALPILGVLLWWMIGRTYFERTKRRWARSKEVMTQHLCCVRETIAASPFDVNTQAKDGGEAVAEDDPESNQPLVFRQDEGVFPSTQGNRVRVFASGCDAFDAFADAVEQATDHIHFEFYIWQRDEVGRRFRDLLVEKAEQGVEVRVLYDAVGGAPVKNGFMDPLIEAGGKVTSFLPVVLFESQLRVNFRNHRKIIVVDGEVGFTGGLNIGEEYNDWVDLAFRLEGPVVLQLQEVFAEDWYFATGEDLASTDYFRPPPEPPDRDAGLADAFIEAITARIIASGPDNRESVIENAFFMAITSAEERIYITTPYFVPDQAILMAIKTAALRGVDVRLLTPGKCDVPIAQAAGRSYYAELLEAGVSIYEYEDSRILHAKAVVIDDGSAIIGSANMDIRSFLLNFEANAVLHSREFNGQMAEIFEGYLERSREMKVDDFTERPLKNRLIESTARLFSPLL